MAPGQNHTQGDHSIEQIPGLSEDQIRRLRDRWIDTAEAFLGVVATPEAKPGLAQLLELSLDQLEPLIQQAVEIVGADTARRLSSPQRGGPTGATLTDEQRRRWGLR